MNGEDVSASEVASYSFYVYKEDTQNIAYREGIISLLTEDVVDQSVLIREITERDGETGEETVNETPDLFHIQLYQNGVELKTGDVISIGETAELSEQNLFYQISDLSETTIDGRDVYDLQASFATPSQVYSNYEVYFNQSVNMEDLADTFTEKEEEIIAQLQNSDEYWATLAATLDSMKECESVQNALSLVSDEDAARFMNMSLKDSLSALQGKVVPTGHLEIGTDDKGQPYGTVTLGLKTNDIEFELGKSKEDAKTSIMISFTIEISETFKVESSGYTVYLGDDKYCYTASYLDSQTTLGFEASISVGDKNRDITDELEKSMDSAGNRIQKYIEVLKEDDELFETDLDYVTLVEVPLGQITFTVYSFSFQVELTFKVSIGVQAGIGVEMSYWYREMIYSGNGELRRDANGNQYIYHYTNNQDMGGRYTIISTFKYSVVIKGKIGIRVGLNVNLNVSLVGLNSLVNVGFSVEVGVYAELGGFIQLDGWVNTGGHGEKLFGAFNLEIGVYVELAFTYKFFTEKGYYPLYTYQFPILRIGASSYVLGFETEETSITLDSPEYNLPEDNGFDLAGVNLTGDDALVDVNFAVIAAQNTAKFTYLLRSNDKTKGTINATVDNGGHIKITDPEKRQDFDVWVRYNSSNSVDGKPISKVFHVTYLPKGIDDKLVTARYYYGDTLFCEESVYAGYAPNGASYETIHSLSYQEGTHPDYENMYTPALDIISEDTEYQLNVIPFICNIEITIDLCNYEYGTVMAEDPVFEIQAEYGTKIDLNKYLTDIDEDYTVKGDWCLTSSTGILQADTKYDSELIDGRYLMPYTLNTKVRLTADNLDQMTLVIFHDEDFKFCELRYMRAGTVPVLPEIPAYQGIEYKGYKEWYRSDWGNVAEPIQKGEERREYRLIAESMNQYVFYDFSGQVIARKYAFDFDQVDTSDIIVSDIPQGYEFAMWFTGESKRQYEETFTETNQKEYRYLYTQYNCYPSYQVIKKDVTITFDTTGYEKYSNAAYAFTGSNITQKVFMVPSVKYTMRDQQYDYSLYWEGTDEAGNTITMHPGEQLFYKNYTNVIMKPVIQKTLRDYKLYIYSNVDNRLLQEIDGKYGTVVTQNQIASFSTWTHGTYEYIYAGIYNTRGVEATFPITLGTEGYDTILYVYYDKKEIVQESAPVIQDPVDPGTPVDPTVLTVIFSSTVQHVYVNLDYDPITDLTGICSYSTAGMTTVNSTGTAEDYIYNGSINGFVLTPEEGYYTGNPECTWATSDGVMLESEALCYFGDIPALTGTNSVTLYATIYVSVYSED